MASLDYLGMALGDSASGCGFCRHCTRVKVGQAFGQARCDKPKRALVLMGALELTAHSALLQPIKLETVCCAGSTTNLFLEAWLPFAGPRKCTRKRYRIGSCLLRILLSVAFWSSIFSIIGYSCTDAIRAPPNVILDLVLGTEQDGYAQCDRCGQPSRPEVCENLCGQGLKTRFATWRLDPAWLYLIETIKADECLDVCKNVTSGIIC